MAPDADALAAARRIVEEVLAAHEAAGGTGTPVPPEAGWGEGTVTTPTDAGAVGDERPDTEAWRAARRIVEEVLSQHEARGEAPTDAPTEASTRMPTSTPAPSEVDDLARDLEGPPAIPADARRADAEVERDGPPPPPMARGGSSVRPMPSGRDLSDSGEPAEDGVTTTGPTPRDRDDESSADAARRIVAEVMAERGQAPVRGRAREVGQKREREDPSAEDPPAEDPPAEDPPAEDRAEMPQGEQRRQETRSEGPRGEGRNEVDPEDEDRTEVPPPTPFADDTPGDPRPVDDRPPVPDSEDDSPEPVDDTSPEPVEEPPAAPVAGGPRAPASVAARIVAEVMAARSSDDAGGGAVPAERSDRVTDRTQQLPMGDLPPGPAIVSEARNGTGTAPREDEPTEETAVGAALVAEARTQAGAEARTEDRAEVGAVGLPDEPADPALSDATDELVARNVPPVVDEVPGSTPAPVGSMPTAMPGVQDPLADGASIDDVWANDRWPSGDDVDATWLELRPETPGTPETPETPETPGTPDEPNGGLDDQDDAAGADADLEDRSDPAGGWDVPGPTSPIQNTGPHAPPAPPPRRTGRWLLTTVLGAIGLALLFPLAIGALLDLVSLS